MKFLTIAFFLLSCLCAVGAPENDFCTSYMELLKDTKHSHKPLSNLMTMVIAPRKMIRAGYLGESGNLSKDSSSTKSSKVIFVHLSAPEFDINIIKNLKIKKNEIAKLKIIPFLSEVKTIQDCQNVIANHAEDFLLVEEYLRNYSLHQSVIKASQEKKLLTQLSRKLQRYIRMGWKVSYVPDLFQMYRQLESDQFIEEIMLVAHSDQQGRLYDSQKNILPKGAFSNLPRSVRKVIVYSCHADQVINFYEIKKNTAKFDYYFPVVTKNFQDLFESQIPVAAINGMGKAAKAEIRSKSSQDDACSLSIEMKKGFENIVVMINDHFAGTAQSAESHLRLDCQLLSNTSNQVKIFYLGEVNRFPLEVTRIVIETSNGNFHELEIKEFQSHFDKKHILTLGITGGIL